MRLTRIQTRILLALVVGLGIFLYRSWKARQVADQHYNETSIEQPRDQTATTPSDSLNAKNAGKASDHNFDLPYGGKGQVVNNGCYVISYVEEYEQPEWTEYVLDGSPMMKIKRENDRFVEDPAIKTGSAVAADYRKSGYDRGHLVPAADMKASMDCFTKSFLLSNISPQAHEFNTGVWRRLEESVRKWSKKKAPIQIICGPILKKGLRNSIGKENKIRVPEEYYKVVVHKGIDGYRAVGFIMPNKGSDLSVEKFAVSVGQVERRTGLDFNRSLPDSLERAIENNFNLKYWFN